MTNFQCANAPSITVGAVMTSELLEVLMTRHEKVTESVRLMAFDAPGRAYTPEEEQRIARAQNALIRFNDILLEKFQIPMTKFQIPNNN